MNTSPISNKIVATCLILLSSHVIVVILADETVFGAEDPCSPYNTGMYPHPLECQLYFNCSQTYKFEMYWSHVEECKYPDLFSSVSLRCEKHQDVKCERRKELIHACEYHRNKCNRGHCRQCKYTWPKCDVKDGKTHYQEMKGTSLYGICEGWRVVELLECEKYSVFDAATKTCKFPSA